MSFQPSLDLPIEIGPEAYTYGTRAGGDTHGVVLTKPHVVELILDLAGYSASADLGSKALLEPSCGNGAFLLAAASRLLASAHLHRRNPATLGNALASFDIDEGRVMETRQALLSLLAANDLVGSAAQALVQGWVSHADFLLAPFDRKFDFVVGNPPYIRIEQFSPELQGEYRRRFSTIFDRADLYVAFIERGLDLLNEIGVLSFICADRWTLNQYGRRLRGFISSRFHVHTYVDLHTASPFESSVVAYPSIFVIGPASVSQTQVASLSTADPGECAELSRSIRTGSGQSKVSVYDDWFVGEAPWVLSSPDHLRILRRLEAQFPLLEQDGRATVRIGVATGCDSVYVVPASLDVEPDRLVPLVKREDIHRGQITDARRCVINTSADKGLIQLGEFPRLAAYFASNSDSVRARRVSKDNRVGWFRTIDRVHTALVRCPKLLIPDIAGANEVAYDEGRFYPHHNLYFVTSDYWDLEVLGGLLSSRVSLFFVWSYAVKMRGGYLRFQAQYLRRIRVPDPRSLSPHLQDGLRSAFRARDFEALDRIACECYGLAELPAFDFVDTRS